MQNCLKYLDTVSISQRLHKALKAHGLAKSVKYMLANQPIMTNKFGLEPEQILRIEDLQDFMHALFPQKDVLSSE